MGKIKRFASKENRRDSKDSDKAPTKRLIEISFKNNNSQQFKNNWDI